MITKKNTKFLAQYGSPAHVDELIKTPDDVFGSNPVLHTLVKHHALRDDHMDTLVHDKRTMSRMAVHPGLNQSHIDHIINSDLDYIGKQNIISNPNLKPHHLDYFIKNLPKESWDNYGPVRALLRHPSITPDQKEKIITHPNENTRKAAAESNSLSADHIEKMSHDPDSDVRLALIYNHKLTDEQVHRFANDPNAYIRREANLTIASRKNK